jgi:hypothetical protein
MLSEDEIKVAWQVSERCRESETSVSRDADLQIDRGKFIPFVLLWVEKSRFRGDPAFHAPRSPKSSDSGGEIHVRTSRPMTGRVRRRSKNALPSFRDQQFLQIHARDEVSKNSRTLTSTLPSLARWCTSKRWPWRLSLYECKPRPCPI